MFIYEFMSELLRGSDDIIDENEDYDPHKHRIIAKPTTYLDTMIHMLKGSIGAGILAMPEAVKRTGLIGGAIGLVALGIFAVYCLQILIQAQYLLCKRERRGYMAFPKSMRVAIQQGPPRFRFLAFSLGYFVDVVLVMWQLGICCIYFVFVAENTKQLCDYYGIVISLRLHLCYILIPTVIVNMVKDLKLMTPLSTISNAVTILGLILVFFYMIEDDVTIDKEKLQIKHIADIPVFIGTALFAMEAVGVILALEYNMEHPKQFVGCCGLLNIGFAIIVGLYLLMGVFGYLKYGDETKASITLNLPQDQKKSQAAKIIFAVAIFLSFPLQNFVAYNIMWRRIQKRIQKKVTLTDYLLRIVLVIIPWILAVAVPQLGPFIALFGALCLSLLAIVFPAIMDMCVWYAHPSGYGKCRYRLIRDILIVIIGMMCLISGVYTSLLEIFAHGL